MTSKEQKDSTPQANEGEVVTATAHPISPDPRASFRKRCLIGSVVVVVLLVIIFVVIIASSVRRLDDVGDYVLPTINYATGASLITSYDIKAKIGQRIARSVITMEIDNALDCTSVHAITLQLPPYSRVASLKTLATDGCETTGVVKDLEEARETFEETVLEGIPSAYVEAQDAKTYSIQASLPPLGSTTVELVIEELLHQEKGMVEFQVPFVPGEKVDQISLEVQLMIPDEAESAAAANSTSTGKFFDLDLGPDLPGGTVPSPYTLSLSDAREYDIPALLRGRLTPGVLPDEGILVQDADCFEHIFSPSSLTPRNKNIHFVIDLSSYGGSDTINAKYLSDTKKALKTAIDSLDDEDTLTIQGFSARGTEELWGTAKATPEEKVDAKEFVDELQLLHDANLQEALLQGLLRSKTTADSNPDFVTIMVVISKYGATYGGYGGFDAIKKIVENVWKLNREGKVKIFAMTALQADDALLQAISTTNGGKSVRIETGATGYADQMERFFAREVGTILLADVEIEYTGAAVHTRSSFPLLSQGTELLVRGLVADASLPLQAVATGNANSGMRSWNVTSQVDPFVESLGLPNSRCFQSYAHARIERLVEFYNIAPLLGGFAARDIIKLEKPCKLGEPISGDSTEKTTLRHCIREEALGLALKAELVVPTLTAIATADNDKCFPVEEGAEICLAGTQKSWVWNDVLGNDSSEFSGSRSFSLFLSVFALVGYMSWALFNV